MAYAERRERQKGVRYRGIDHLLDTGQIASAVRELYPDGVDAALDLVGTPTLPDTLRAVRVHGTACFSGSLSNQWTVPDFAPNEYLPKGVRLAGYPATPRTCRGRLCRRSWTRSPPVSCPSRWTASTTAWNRSGRPTTTWNRPRHRQARRPHPALKTVCRTAAFTPG